MARLKAAARMRQHHQPGHLAAPPRLLKHVPARLPPSQQVINDWLDADNPTHPAAGGAAATSSVSTAAQAAAGSGFVMDANTGRLVPLQTSATQVPYESSDHSYAAEFLPLFGCSCCKVSVLVFCCMLSTLPMTLGHLSQSHGAGALYRKACAQVWFRILVCARLVNGAAWPSWETSNRNKQRQLLIPVCYRTQRRI